MYDACFRLTCGGLTHNQYNDIRAETGSKNIMISNRLDGTPMAGDSTAVTLHEHVKGTFMKHRSHTYHLWVVFHELFGHGTGMLLRGAKGEACNFDIDNPPISPLSGKPIDTWYKPNETFTGVFKDIATSVDECRAECIGAYLLSEVDLLALCGYPKDGDIKPSDRKYRLAISLAPLTIHQLSTTCISSSQWQECAAWRTTRWMKRYGCTTTSRRHLAY
jgi:dipeptidyl-peptidase-3